MSDRPDLDEAIRIAQEGGLKITGGKYAPTEDTPNPDIQKVDKPVFLPEVEQDTPTQGYHPCQEPKAKKYDIWCNHLKCVRKQEDTPTPDEKRRAVIDNLNAGRKPYHHLFEITGKCRNCSTRIADLPVGKALTNLDLLCRTITPEEVARFRDYDAR